MPSQYLQGMDIEVGAAVVNVQEQLRCLADSCDGFEGMAISHQSKIGNGVELKKIGAGNPEEIADAEVLFLLSSRALTVT